jgi:glucosamine-6-phosphate deaminase
MQQIPIEVFSNSSDAAAKLAAETANLIRTNNQLNKKTVLGLATGSTPIVYYKELIRLHNEQELSFSDVITFNLDEYSGLPKEHPESYWSFMHKHLFDHIDILSDNINLPSGTIPSDKITDHCLAYEKSIVDAGGIDLQILGIGRTGHIGFNEPGSPKDSITREIQLDPITREDAAPSFNGINHVPHAAITMGCGTILGARRIVLMAWGANKASIVHQAVTGPVNDLISASYLQQHQDSVFFLDSDAASLLEESTSNPT